MRSLGIAAASVALLTAAPALADAELARSFARHGARGTFVLSPLAGGRDLIHDPARARRRFTPASTFKIPNSAIALEEGIVDERTTLRWDGKEKGRPEWNRDHTLESAFRVSCVWCYQRLAERLGPARYRSYLARLRYGNAVVGKHVTSFWLDGSLQVSALEQIAFLRALATRQLPFKASVYEALARIMVLERGPKHVLRAKTGWSREARIGWLVGEVTSDERGRFLFAMNLDLVKDADAAKRLVITREVLRAKRLLP